MKQGFLFFGLGIGLGLLSAIFILLVKGPVIMFYKGVEADAKLIADDLMIAISLIIVFQATNSIMTK